MTTYEYSSNRDRSPRNSASQGPADAVRQHVGARPRGAAPAARVGPSFRSRRAVCVRGVRDTAADAPHDSKHESPPNPYDNASFESFMKTLKREEIYANTYRDLDHRT